MKKPNFAIEPAALDAKQSAAFLNVSLRKFDELCANGDLRPLRIGKKRLFMREQLLSLLKRAAVEPVG